MVQDLNIDLRSDIDQTFRSAKELLKNGHTSGALELGESAWAKLPEPKFGWDVSKSYAHALATLYRDAKKYTEAISLMSDLFKSGTVLDHQDRPRFIVGTIYFEAGQMTEAKKWLMEANTISKGRCFREEPSKYKAILSE